MKKAKRSAWYTSTYSTILDSPEFERLSLYAAACWWALKHCPENNQLGLFVFFNEQVRHRAKIPPEKVQDAIRELERERWIVTDGRWVWLRNHLKFDPHYSPDNPNHVKGLVAKIEALPRMPLLAQLVGYYKSLKHAESGTPYLPESYVYPECHGDGMGDGTPKAMSRKRRSRGDAMGNPHSVAVTDTDTKPTDVPGAGAPGLVPVEKPWSAEACEDWSEAFQGVAHGGKIGSALKPLVQKLGWPTVRPAWRAYLAGTEARYASPADFAAKPGPWLNTVSRGAPARASPRVAAREGQITENMAGGLKKRDRWSMDSGDGGPVNTARPRLAAGGGGSPVADPSGEAEPPER